jgi:hypothetical protein
MIENIKTLQSEAPIERALAVRDLLSDLDLPEGRLTIDDLERVALAVAARAEIFADLVVDDPWNRWWLELFKTDNVEVRVLSWEVEQRSDWHDHGGSSGVFVVTQGTLYEMHRAEDLVDVDARSFATGELGSFGPDYVHDMIHESGAPAVSVHAYSPPLTGFTAYLRTEYGFVAEKYVSEDERRGVVF